MVQVPLLKNKKRCLFVNNNQHALITEIEEYIINKVKEIRIEKGISQLALSQKISLSSSFISHVESNKRRAKYNINHLNLIAKALDCSPKDFMPEKPL